MNLLFVLKFGQFIFQREHKYAGIRCKKEGIYIYFSNEMDDEQKIWLACGTRRNVVSLPFRIMKGYKFGDYEEMVKQQDGSFFVKGKAVPQKLPKPYQVRLDDVSVPKEEDVFCEKKKTLNATKISMNKNNILGTDVVVEFRCGSNNYIRIRPYVSGEEIPSLNELRDEYGANLLYYPYSSIRYRQDNCNNKSVESVRTKNCLSAVNLNALFLRKLNMQSGDPLVYCEMKDGTVILKKEASDCFLDKKEIDPLTFETEEAFVCEDCRTDQDDILEIIGQFNKIMKYCENTIYENKELREEINKLKKGA